MCFAHELVQEVLVEPVQVLERVEQREPRAHAEEQRDLAESRLEVDDHRLPLGQPRELDGAVHGHRRRAGAALGAEEDQRRRRRLGRARGRCRGAPPSAARRPGTSPPARGHMKNSFAPARIAWRISSGSVAWATAKIAASGGWRAAVRWPPCPRRRRRGCRRRPGRAMTARRAGRLPSSSADRARRPFAEAARCWRRNSSSCVTTRAAS